MTLLNMDDAGPATPRMLPKVFADVPSTAELRAAQDAASRAKSASGTLTIIAVLMAGALIAVAAFLVITLGNQSKAIQAAKDTAAADVKAAQLKQTEAEGNLTKLTTELSGLKLTYRPLEPLAELDDKIMKEAADIKAKLDLPAYSGANATSIKLPEAWAAYNAKNIKWPPFDGNGDWHTFASTNLSKHLDLLKTLNARVAEFKPSQGGGGTKPPCLPTTPGYPNCP